jgi:4-diphosphocytidyl-2-C-methyl-D-erythritol kinase
MIFTATCSIKINVTLRVLDKRGDGYHEIFSLFWKLASPEHLDVVFGVSHDSLTVYGAEINGENIVTRACRHVRKVDGEDSLPPVAVSLYKYLPAGGGVGAGSGNAAAFLRLIGKGAVEGIASLGADVAFLASNYDLAAAGGVGDELEGLSGGLSLRAAIFFPDWNLGTASMYAALDEQRANGGFVPMSREAAREEAMGVLADLRRGEKIGFLPNDFTRCVGYEAEYAELAREAECSRALAWGLCGSGSAFFALYYQDDAEEFLSRLFVSLRKNSSKFRWLRQILVLG